MPDRDMSRSGYTGPGFPCPVLSRTPLTHVVQRAGLSGTMTTTGTRTQSGATALARPIGRCRPEPFAINPTAREVEGCQLTHGVTIVPARLTWLRVATTTVAQC